jgi:hypothetical protein
MRDPLRAAGVAERLGIAVANKSVAAIVAEHELMRGFPATDAEGS